MSDLEKLDVYIIEDPDADTEGGTPIASFETAEIAKGSAAVQIPETMEGGSYYVRLVYSQEEVTTGISLYLHKQQSAGGTCFCESRKCR